MNHDSATLRRIEQLLERILEALTPPDIEPPYVNDFCPHGRHVTAPCGDCTIDRHGENPLGDLLTKVTGRPSNPEITTQPPASQPYEIRNLGPAP